MAYKALVIDDDVATLGLLKYQLESEGFKVTTAENGTKGISFINDGEFDVIVTDLNLPDINGMEIARNSKNISPLTEIIMVTGHDSFENAIEAGKAGVSDFLTKPFNFDELFFRIQKAVERKKERTELKELRGKVGGTFAGIVGSNRSMQDIYEIINSVAESDANILILGESGTGKEVISNAIHSRSHRSKKPFVKVNCSALPKDLIESQLFGHIKGAFTGAQNDKSGFIGQANTGSLLLDEIGEMPIDLQPKLLRVLQDKIYYRVGSDKPQEVDFRLISATNRNPFEAIQDGNLREDLYYRINTIEIKIPPLRERMDDVPILAEHFLRIYADKYNKHDLEFSTEAFEQMLNYNWRGNVRELQHVLERAVLLSKGNKITNLNVPKNMESTIAFSDIKIPENNAKSIAAVVGGNEPDGNSNQTNSFSETANSSNNAILVSGTLTKEQVLEKFSKLVVDSLPEPTDGEEPQDLFNELESFVVLAALKRTKGNKQAAANLLGLYRPRLYGMIKRHNIEEKI